MVTFIFIGVALLLAAVAVLLLRTPATPEPARPSTRPHSSAFERPLTVTPPEAPDRAESPDPCAAPTALPPTLAAFRFVLQDELSADYKRAMVERLRHIPRPAPSLQKLVSKEFMTRATTRELIEVVMCNPLLAAKVLATVNSPFYGLRTPVLSMGQAITFLGFNTVRSIGLRYMLGDSVKAGSPELTRIFDTIWNASALASEL